MHNCSSSTCVVFKSSEARGIASVHVGSKSSGVDVACDAAWRHISFSVGESITVILSISNLNSID
jgi:hypothetical protein